MMSKKTETRVKAIVVDGVVLADDNPLGLPVVEVGTAVGPKLRKVLGPHDKMRVTWSDGQVMEVGADANGLYIRGVANEPHQPQLAVFPEVTNALRVRLLDDR